jgi:hypothetical protein
MASKKRGKIAFDDESPSYSTIEIKIIFLKL